MKPGFPITPHEFDVLSLIAKDVQETNGHRELVDLDLARTQGSEIGEVIINALIFEPAPRKSA